jgi:hypothetical protein
VLDTTRLVSANITAGEVVQPGAVIELRAARPIDRRWAQGTVRLMRRRSTQPVTVELAERGRVLRIPTGDLGPGSYELVVSELLGTKGERLVDRLVVPFSVIPIAGAVPPDLRVEHAVRLVVGELDVQRLGPGEGSRAGHVDVVKAVGRKDGEPVELAFDENGSRVDIDDLLKGVSKRRFEKFGRLHETLWTRIAGAKDDDQVDIVVWARFELPPAPFEKPSERRLEEAPEGERKVTELVRRARGELATLLKRAGIESRPKTGSDAEDQPFIHATATVGQIRELAQSDLIGAILFDDTSEIPDLGDSIAIARSDRAHTAGFDGTGIRVAVWESGPSVTTNLVFANRFTTTPLASAHARLTSAVIKNTEPNLPHGHAPDCDLYSANTGGVDALRWAARDQNCTVISQSFHRSTEPGGAGLQTDDLTKDWLALRWPYPTILQAAGNFWLGDADAISPPEDEFVNHKGFNSLAVGSHDDTAGAMAGDSVFRNPSSSHGDRELPEIAANGTTVSAVSESMSGTSFAAPAAAGVTALLQDVDGLLCSWPEGCRAILMASAGRNVEDQNWWPDVLAGTDASDGAGAVDAQAGVAIARQRRWRDAPATLNGWDVGTLSSASFGGDRLATFRYRVTVPPLLLFPTVKVALAWDSAVTSSGDTATASRLTVDLDLLVRDSHGVLVASAASWDNSYEVAEFLATRGETYEIIIRRWSGTDSVWFGVAWTVNGIRWPFSAFGDLVTGFRAFSG